VIAWRKRTRAPLLPQGRQGLARALLSAVVLALLVAAGGGDARADEGAGKPRRIVSINMCTDELALRLADRAAVASVSWLSQDPRNANMAQAARAVPANDGSAEEALSFHPDIVLAGAFTPRSTIALLQQVGARVARFSVAESLDGVKAQIRAVAAAIGEPERGEALVGEIDRRLAGVAIDRDRPSLRAIILRPNGFTVGPGSLVDEILRRAGMTNLAATLDIGSYQQISLERLALLDADVLIVDNEGFSEPALATRALRHPIVEALARRMAIVSLPSRLWTCPGPGVVEAIERLVAATAGVARREARN
jgi:iron complex transport system substrate-binding protein